MVVADSVPQKSGASDSVSNDERFRRVGGQLKEDRARRRDQRLLQVKPGLQAAGEEAEGAVPAKDAQRFEHGQVIMR